MNKFIKQLCLLTLVVIVASIFARSILTVWWPAIVGFFFIVSMVVFYFADKAKKKDMRKFTNFYMGATVVKMVVYLTIIIIYVMQFKDDAKCFAVTFLIYYLIYSVFETIKLAKKEKKN